MAAGIVLSGVGLQVLLRTLRGKQEGEDKPMNGKKAIDSVIVGIFSGLVLVLPAISALELDSQEPALSLASILALVGTVTGIDSVAKKAVDLGKSKAETAASLQARANALNNKIRKMSSEG